MKFLSDEWFTAFTSPAEQALQEADTNATTTLVEVVDDVWGDETQTVWIYYSVKSGKLDEMSHGTGRDTIPSAEFRTFGDYSDYARVARGELSPQQGLMFRKFRLEGSLSKAMKMMSTYLAISNCKNLPDTQF